MYDTAKKAREAMKNKARRLAGAKDQKVDSSDWTPAEPINADIKTGMRPISRRAYKSGGKVMGEACEPRMDKKPRKSGGKAVAKEMAEEKSEAAEYAKAKTNRDVKAANEDREGIKHIGGMKKGGRAKKQDGGSLPPPSAWERIKNKLGIGAKSTHTQDSGQPKSAEERAEMQKKVEEVASERKYGGRSKHASGGATGLSAQEKIEQYQRNLSKPSRGKAEHYKKGGRAKGGPVAGAEQMMRSAAETSGVPSATLGFTGLKKGILSPLRDLKRGGKAQNRPGKFYGGAMGGGMPPSMPAMSAFPSQATPAAGPMDMGRPVRKAGGRAKTAKSAKGGTKINIMIAAGKPAGPSDMMAPPAGPMGGPPPGLPFPLPTDGGAPTPPMPMPMPMPAAGGVPPMGAPAGLPLPRKSGGRITKVAKSYKDMEAGSGGAEGRLQKTDIAKTGKGAPTYRRGGKVYKSYKDMDAGAASGLGRLEKTEIESKKH
jgi:hypothetical protein